MRYLKRKRKLSPDKRLDAICVQNGLNLCTHGNQGDVDSIGCQHLDLTIQDVRDEINRIGGLEAHFPPMLPPQINRAHAETMDANKGVIMPQQCSAQSASWQHHCSENDIEIQLRALINRR